jgi:hypothetical protein
MSPSAEATSLKTFAKFAGAMLALGTMYGLGEAKPILNTWAYTPAVTGTLHEQETVLAAMEDPNVMLFEQPLPANGEVQMFSTQEAIAPFEIKSSPGANYLVKLEDSLSGQDVMTIFVQGGNTVQVDVPLGTYLVKYASGEHWYGYVDLFGKDTAYAKADETFSFFTEGNEIKGYSITLYKVEGGNLTTTTINRNDF